MAANFLLFLIVDIFEEGKIDQQHFKTEFLKIILKCNKFKSQVFKKYDSCLLASIQLFVFLCTFISSFYSFPWRETYLFTRQGKVQIGKNTFMKKYQGGNAYSDGKRTPFPSISFLKGHVLSIF